MAFRIRGWNDFYEGWLACLFGRPRDEGRGPDWQEGWAMADETSREFAMTSLPAEIDLGHVVIEEG